MSLAPTEIPCPKCRAWIGEGCSNYESLRTVSSHIAAASGKVMDYVPCAPHDARLDTAQSTPRGRHLSELEMTVRVFRAMASEGIEWEGQLAGVSDAELLRIPGFGRKSLNIVRGWQGGTQ